LIAALEVKLKAPNGVNFTTKGTSPQGDNPISASVNRVPTREEEVDN